jgi:hypothetical protein
VDEFGALYGVRDTDKMVAFRVMLGGAASVGLFFNQR